jgi:hypothetical protein
MSRTSGSYLWQVKHRRAERQSSSSSFRLYLKNIRCILGMVKTIISAIGRATSIREQLGRLTWLRNRHVSHESNQSA